MDLFDLASLSAAELTDIRQQIKPLRTLGDLLDWSRQLAPPVPSPIVVTQDEYAHDVRWLDFDTT